MKVLHHQQSFVYHQASPNCESRRICYNDVRYQQQDICDAFGHLGARKNSDIFRKVSLS